MSSLSIIIPTLNEAEGIADTLRCFAGHEVVVVDGGSEDDTVAIAQAEGCRVEIASQPGRAAQMNQGAALTSGEALLFVHGDTRVDSTTLQALEEALASDEALIGGGFARRFDSPSLLLKFTAWCSDFRGRWWGLFLGDQGIFVRRSVFEPLGGFDESIYPGEDLDFSYRMAKLGKTALVGPPVISSARRFDLRGPLRQTWRDMMAARSILKGSKERLER